MELQGLSNSSTTLEVLQKESIEDMKKVEIEEDDGGEGVVKEMPCKHRFHGKCIEKWLGIHRSCFVCRYQIHVDEKDDGMKMDEVEGGERRRVGGGEVWVSFSFLTRGLVFLLTEVGEIKVKQLLVVILMILHQALDIMMRLRIKIKIKIKLLLVSNDSLSSSRDDDDEIEN